MKSYYLMPEPTPEWEELLKNLNNNVSHITAVYLANEMFDNHSMIALCNALRYNTHVVSLKIEKCFFPVKRELRSDEIVAGKDYEIAENVCQAFRELLTNNSTIVHLSLKDSARFSEQLMIAICEGLSENNKILSVNFPCYISTVAEKMLQKNKTLCAIFIGSVPINKLKSIVTRLKQNRLNNPEIKSLTQKAAKGDTQAQFDLAEKYTQYGETEIARKLYRQAANNGHPAAQTEIARTLVRKREHVFQQYNKAALTLFNNAVQENYAPAEMLLGEIYLGLCSVPELHAESAMNPPSRPHEGQRLLEKAAAQGDILAQFHLALLYDGNPLYDVGSIKLDKDLEKSTFWYQKMSQQEKAEWTYVIVALYQLGIRYENGKGIAKNHSEAVKCYLKIIEHYWAFDFLKAEKFKNLSSDVWYKLGKIYEIGDGVDIDLNRAYFFYKRWYAWGGMCYYDDQEHEIITERLNWFRRNKSSKNLSDFFKTNSNDNAATSQNNVVHSNTTENSINNVADQGTLTVNDFFLAEDQNVVDAMPPEDEQSEIFCPEKNDSIALSGKPEVAKNQLIELQQNLQQQLLENERQQEQLKAMIEKSQRIESNFNGTEALQQQLIQTFNQHQILWAKHSAVEARQRAVEAFKTRPNQWEFYHGLLIRLEEFVIGCKTAASKFFDVKKSGKLAEKAGWLDVVATLVSFFPIVGREPENVLRKISDFLKKVDHKQQVNIIKTISRIGTLSEMQVVIADFAFRLTEIYADNLQQLLTEDEIAQQPKSILAEDTWIVGVVTSLKEYKKRANEFLFKEPPQTQVEALADFTLGMVVAAFFGQRLQLKQDLTPQLLAVIIKPPVSNCPIQETLLLACSDKLIIRTQQRLIMKYFFNNAGIKTADGRYFAINGVMTKYGFRQGTLEEVQVLNLKEVVSLSNTVTTISVSESDESLKEGKPVATSTFQHVQMQLTLAAPVSQAVPAVHNSELDIIKQQLEEERKLRRQHEEEIKAMQMKMEKLMRLHDLNDVDQSVDLGSQLQLKTQAKQQNSVHTGRPKATEQVLQIAYIEQQLVYHGKTLKKILDATQLTEVSDEETDPNADEREELFADNVSLT